MTTRCFVIIGNIDHIMKVIAVLRKEFGDIKIKDLIQPIKHSYQNKSEESKCQT